MTESRYRDIADVLEREIADLPPGTRLDSEHALMKRFGVGRSAARSAVQELERRLRVRRIQGSGTFVSERIDYVISRDRRPSWHRTVREAGGVPRTVVLDHRVAPLEPDCASLLEVPVGTPAHRLVRSSYIDDMIAAFSFEWITHDAIPDLSVGMRVEESLDEVLRQMGHVHSVRSWCRTASDIPPADVQARLELTTAVPVWVVESVNRDIDSGVALTYSKSWMRGDSVRVVMEIGEPAARFSVTPNETKEVVPQ
ncbi:GntR family transcriptional regulator [Rhodococcus sp. ABRD24]|uniref:GntR family transcriptional regulator n=1 Tax=Rhodococcus sp. ABRD24 TaxID=2507582 RepID=UPI001039FB8E|nr:GntR family transcriptional regulator [Rhodococcus sp. ABRD24]QBJ96453.1 GntR family transcriptional regulator [Rhodococcus sp. ABRD24]